MVPLLFGCMPWPRLLLSPKSILIHQFIFDFSITGAAFGNHCSCQHHRTHFLATALEEQPCISEESVTSRISMEHHFTYQLKSGNTAITKICLNWTSFWLTNMTTYYFCQPDCPCVVRNENMGTNSSQITSHTWKWEDNSRVHKK
jgi:hypothetical protein